MMICRENIMLRGCEPHDYRLFRKIFSNRETTGLLFRKHRHEKDISEEEWQRKILSDNQMILLVIEIDRTLPIGFFLIEIPDWKNGSVEIDYAADPEHFHKQNMVSAISALNEYYFDQLRIETIVAYCIDKDVSKQEVLETAGFKRDAILNSRIVRNGEKPKVYLYTLVPDDLKQIV